MGLLGYDNMTNNKKEMENDKYEGREIHYICMYACAAYASSLTPSLIYLDGETLVEGPRSCIEHSLG